MKTRSAAQIVVEDYLRSLEECGSEVELTISDVREFPSGWVFYFRARDPEVRLAGNAPLLVPKDGEALFVVGYHRPIEESMEIFERFGNPNAVAQPEVRIAGYSPGTDLVQASRLIRDASGLGLMAAKQSLLKRASGEVLAVPTPDVPTAHSLATELSALGVQAEVQHGT